jgi:PAS domain S-box-containing protein
MQRKGIHILHVDDNKDDLTIFKYNLTSFDKDIYIRWASSGEEAIKILQNEEFDCIISDYEMSPGMKGIDLLKCVRREYPNIPFIFLTGQGNEEIAAEAFRQGANDYYTKEYSLIYFRRILNSINQSISSFNKHLEGELIQKSLMESEERYKRLVELNPKAIVVHSESKITYINKAALKIIGKDLKPEYMIGKNVTDLIHPEYREDALKKIDDALQGKLQSKPSIYPAFLPGDKKTFVEVKSIPITFEGQPAVLSVLDNIEILILFCWR